MKAVKALTLCLVTIGLVVFTAFNLNAGSFNSHKKKAVKKAILLVAFGTSEESAWVSFKNIEKITKKKFPDIEIRWAYTAAFIRKKMAKKGVKLDSPLVALAKLSDEGYTHVVVQSLHTIPGAEYDDLLEVVNKFKSGDGHFESIVLGEPMLSNYENLVAAVKAMLKNVPKSRKPDEGVVFVGHGTHHFANLIYVAFQQVLTENDKRAFIGTVEGNPTLDDVLKECKDMKIKKVYLMPFLAVAGNHAKNDMAGDEDDSWKSVFNKNGIETEIVMKGTAEYDDIVEIWMKNLKKAFDTKAGAQ